MTGVLTTRGKVLATAVLLILGAALLEGPSAHPVVLAELHAGTWWGALLIVLGAVYTLKFFPGRGK